MGPPATARRFVNGVPMYGDAIAVCLIVACVGVALMVTVLQTRFAYRQTAFESAYMSLATAAGICALASSSMYYVYFRVPAMLPLAAGDAAMVIAPALMWMALVRLSGQSRVWLIPALAGPFLVGACTVLLPEPASLVIKIAFMALYCSLIVVASLRESIRRHPGVLLIRVTGAAYAVFSVIRLAVLLSLGPDSVIYETFLDIGPTTLAGGLAVIAMATGSLLLGRAVQRPSSQPAPPPAEASVMFVEIADHMLIRDAMGSATANALSRSLIPIVAEVAHIVEIRRTGVVIAAPTDQQDAVSASIRERYEQVAAPATSLPLNRLEFFDLAPVAKPVA